LTYEFKCEEGHVTTRRFKTLGGAIAHFDNQDTADTYQSVQCGECPIGVHAARIYGNSGTVFYGQGWDKPAPSGKTSTRSVDPTKAMSSLGPPRDRNFMGRPGVR
jgi:hypothetical protein